MREREGTEGGDEIRKIERRGEGNERETQRERTRWKQER